MDLLATHAARQPDHPAIVDGDTVLSWHDFFERRNRLAHGLVRLGLKPGDHAIVYAPNSADVLLAGAAVRAASAVPVPMNHRLTADEAAYLLDNSDAVLAFLRDGEGTSTNLSGRWSSRVRYDKGERQKGGRDMCNQVEELKQLVKAWDAFFDARCQRIGEQDGHPAIKLWALSKYMRLRAGMQDILKEAVRHAEHAAGQA